ncbi:MAG: hypothetical protein RBU29_07150, partial [bacterium]|nr:hypothetical protein [bacterium]
RTQFNSAFFKQAPYVLLDLVPEAESYCDLIRVIDIQAMEGIESLEVIADPQTQMAVCYLVKKTD